MNLKNKWILMPLLSLGILVAIAAGGMLVQALWNWLLPTIFGVREVTFWQALGLLLLSRILFGGYGKGGGSHVGGHQDRRDWWKHREGRARSGAEAGPAPPSNPTA